MVKYKVVRATSIEVLENRVEEAISDTNLTPCGGVCVTAAGEYQARAYYQAMKEKEVETL